MRPLASLLLRLLLHILLPSHICYCSAVNFCGVDPSSSPTPPDEADKCTADNWNNLPPIINRTSTGISYCEVVFLLDLSPEYITEEEYDKAFLPSLMEMSDQCLHRGVGSIVTAYPMFNQTGITQKTCCSEDTCDETFNPEIAKYSYWVSPYAPTTNTTYWPEDHSANFSFVFLQELKSVAKYPCLYNTVVLITNRMFAYQEGLLTDFPRVPNESCITFTVVLVGRPDISNEEFSTHYGPLTSKLLQIHNVSCIYELAHCIPPCGSEGLNKCYGTANENCPFPTTPPSTPAPTRPLRTTAASEYGGDYWHVVYLFALSNKTKEEEFRQALYYVETPLKECLDSNMKMVVRFLAENTTDSGWLIGMDKISAFISSLIFEEITVPATRTVDENETYTVEMVIRAVDILHGEQDASRDGAKVILMTDFVSTQFVQAYALPNSHPWIKDLQQTKDFEVYAFEEAVADEYKRETLIKTTKIHVDDQFEKEPGPSICMPPPSDNQPGANTTIWFIIIGTSFGLMVVLLVCTIVYRQKMMWMQKLYLFKHNGDDTDSTALDDDDIIDYWELSWDKLIVRSERLGHGAYGQVYKGKLVGSSPGLEQYYHHESGAYRDCDCAVKMLPKNANEKAHAEFISEIDWMKSIGFNDNIVNMLGCITQSATRSCLVLEFCSNRDLKRYLQRRKAELEESRSIDDQIDCTKEFLHFAWQVASGMQFLVSRNVIHRDVAARNILIDEMKNAKIGDFGLCVQAGAGGEAPNAHSSGRLPIKWLALECLLVPHRFSYKSDVWSYGMVLFEMYSMGENPFDGIDASDILEHIRDGGRPKKPLLASDKIGEVMGRCWEEDPSKRPSFDELLTIFTILLEQATEGYGYLQLMKGNEEHYKEHRNAEIATAPEEELDTEFGKSEEKDKKGRSRAGSTTRTGGTLVVNVTNVLRAAAQGIGRQFSAGREAYPTQDRQLAQEKRKKAVTATRGDSIPPTERPRRKSNDFFAWAGIGRARRRSFDPSTANAISRPVVPRLPPASQPTAPPTRKTSQSFSERSVLRDGPVPPPLAPPLSSDDSDGEMATLPSSPRSQSIDTLSHDFDSPQ